MALQAIKDLIAYGIRTQLIQPCDETYVTNAILEALQIEEYVEPDDFVEESLELILAVLLKEACEKGIIQDNIVERDLFDTKLMGLLTPYPREVIHTFNEKYKNLPLDATQWYYEFSQNTDYIRRYRIEKDRRWKTGTVYGELDVTINLSKPEKDPKAIAAAKNAPQSGYPKCLLCSENEGYAGRMNHPARQNHRIIPVEIGGKDWFLQYSPYVYYNEHCILFSGTHTPMKIERNTFEKMIDFLEQFPHYFVGSNADLPIVGGSVLSHDHFQGGCYTFAMEKAEVEEKFTFEGYDGIIGGIVNWPMSVIRLQGKRGSRLVELADHILTTWQSYTDENACIYAYTGEIPHNTITPIARMNGELIELDLVLRNNITTEEYPMGVYHPHQHLHHIKKENIGLIEVMGLAILPPRLLEEMQLIQECLLGGTDLYAREQTATHGKWVESFVGKYQDITVENVKDILETEIGLVFAEVLECAGVYKRTPQGKDAFRRFITRCSGVVME
ncbi:MAG: UDP-glucose--hexose-1-phosphate uridylyltransferase [Eubacteriales bacterium]